MAKVKVPKAVLDGLEAVRRSGLTNMLECARRRGGILAISWPSSRGVRDPTPNATERGGINTPVR